jgi:PPOX class probable F420-dependent enzyme
VRLTNNLCWEHLRGAGHAILSTSNPKGTIDAVPVCFAVSGKLIATPIDRVKPKDTNELGRLKNLDKENRATLICDHWSRHDWSQLWWVRAHLVRRSNHDLGDKVRDACEAALREKYEQYRGTDFDELIVFDVKTLVGWSAAEDDAAEGVEAAATPASAPAPAPSSVPLAVPDLPAAPPPPVPPIPSWPPPPPPPPTSPAPPFEPEPESEF